MRTGRKLALVLSAALPLSALVAIAPAADADPGCGTADVARDQPTLSSSNETNDLMSGKAVDGDDTGTRWSSAFLDGQWLRVDLQTPRPVCAVDLVWEAAYASGYRIQVSDDGQSWSTAYQTDRGRGGTEAVPLSTQGRYLRVLGDQRATPYGISLYSLKVHVADAGPSNPPTTPPPTISPSPTPPPPTTSPSPTPPPTTSPPPGDFPTSDTPDFGPAVTVFDPSSTDVQSQVDAAFNSQLRNPDAQFGDQRHTFLFKPGSYDVFANLGYYTSVVGLGKNPDDVTITRNVNVDSGWNAGDESNATQNFWRSAENLSVQPEGGTTRWAVSQAAPMRRVHLKGNLTLGPSNQDNGQGYASGGYLADSRVDGGVSSGSQQQWYTRNSSLGSWQGGVWNMVFSGVQGAPPRDNAHTVLDTTPVTAEKPYLYLDQGKYRVFVPSLRRDATGASWPNTPGDSVALSRFYVAHPGDSAARINAALASGLNLFFTPGVYALDQTLRVDRPDTVVYGLGFPTLVPTGGVDAMAIGDAAGVKVSGLLFDAGAQNSTNLLTVGTAGTHLDHADDPTVVADTYFRVGGPRAGKATNSLVVNSDDTIVDHTWIWRADHGLGVGWDANTADTGLVVNGDDVLATGLFVEHYQRYEVVWNGERGRTIFFQNEMPYDVPSLQAWDSPTGDGYASYKVADGVTSHELWGGGAYTFFRDHPDIRASRGFEVPVRPGVRLHNVFTVSLGDVGGIRHVVNDTGGPVPNPAGNTTPQYVPEYP